MSSSAVKSAPLVNTSASLAEYYDEALEVLRTNSAAKELLTNRHALKFIKDLILKDVKNAKIKKCIEIITPFRAAHTVSTYLLGLSIRDHLQFNTNDWRRLPGEKSPQGSFILFWSWICLCHDIGYRYEENFNDYCSIETITDLISFLRIDYSLLDVSNNKKLIEKYFNKRRNSKKPTLDHGVVGALLLYDALMDMANKSNYYSEIRDHKEFFVKICDTIALHNMWRATNETLEEYQQYELDELIPSNDQHHMIYYKDDALLFLLALVDTIDPIKAFCRDNRYKEPKSVSFVLENTYLRFTNRSGTKKVFLSLDDPVFIGFAQDLIDPKTPISSWLGVYIVYPEKKWMDKKKSDTTLSITIDLQGKSLVSGQST